MNNAASDAPETVALHERSGAGWIVIQFVAIAASVAVCIHGLRSREVLSQVLWSDPRGAALVAVALLTLLAGLQVMARFWRLPFSMVFAVGLVFATGAFAGIGPVAAVLLLLLAAFALGESVVGASADEWFGRPLAALAKIALGCALVSLAVFVLAFTQFNNPAVYLALLALPVIAGGTRLRASLAATVSDWRAWAEGDRPQWSWLASALVAMAVSMRLIVVLYPETGTDALAMHLVIADQLKENGTFHFNVTQSVWAVMPMAADWVIAAAHMLSNEAGARLANFAADLILVGMVFAAAWRLRSRRAAYLAVVLYATTPLLLRESMTLYAENFWSLWCCAGVAFAVLTTRSDRIGLLVAASVLIGVAFAAKVITLFFFIAFFLPVAVYWLSVNWRRGVRNIVICALVIALAGVWPYALAWIKTGNPVFPFYNALFASPYFDASANFDNSLFRPGPAWRLLFDSTFESPKFIEGRAGAMGVLLLLVSLPTLVGALRETWLVRWGLLGSVLFVVAVTHFQSYLRYLLPVLPLLSVAAGACLAVVAGSSRWSRIAVWLLVSCGAVVNLYLTPASSWSDKGLSVPPFHGSAEWRELRQAGAPGTFAVDLLNDFGVKRVLWFGESGYGGAHADVYTTHWHGWATYLQMRKLVSAEAVARWAARNRIDAVVVTVNPGIAKSAAVDAFIARDTVPLATRGGISVYMVKEEVMFTDEKLRNPGFDAGTRAWAGEGSANPRDGTVLVSSTRSMSQPVPVTPGSDYLLEVAARCPQGDAGYRLQVNWLDAAGTFLNANIEVEPCTDAFEQHSMRVTAPLLAQMAVVYASGQDPVATAEFDRVSFRE